MSVVEQRFTHRRPIRNEHRMVAIAQQIARATEFVRVILRHVRRPGRLSIRGAVLRAVAAGSS